MKKKTKLLISVLSASVILAAVGFILIFNGIILLNNPSHQRYPVRGADVSSYQGDIDFKTLASQNLSFVFIKATEGSSYVDEYFDNNYKNALDAGLRVGAYHFFSFDSEGRTQAENFIRTVKKADNMLPPVVDFEFYADKKKNPPDKETARAQLKIMLEMLEDHYMIRPVIYATERSYSMYISGYFTDYDIWIRDVVFAPRLADKREWTFWQYTDREKLKGYLGKEKYIDMNVFNGTAEDFKNYALK